MSVKLRPYIKSDYPIIASWCEEMGISTLTPASLPYSTFVAEENDKPVMSVSLMLNNAKEIASLEYFIADPSYKSDKRQLISKSLVNYVETVAKAMGYKKMVCLAPNGKLKDYYSSFGYQPNLDGLTLMVKEIG